MNERIKKRRIDILKILFNSKSSMTVSELAKMFQVSNRTIRNDLYEVEAFLKGRNLGDIIRKPGVGTWLEIKEENKDKLKKLIESKIFYHHPYSPKERRVYILYKLLKIDRPIIMKDLAEELFVSRITILKDLDTIEARIKKYDLFLLRRQNYGIEITGRELDIRRLIGKIEDEYKVQAQIKQIIYDIEGKQNFKLTEESAKKLSQYIAICMERLKLDKTIKFTNKEKDELKSTKEYKIARLIGERLSSFFEIELPKEEIFYITILLLGSKYQTAIDSANDENVHLAKEIIDLVGNILSIDLTGDKQLLKGLALHLKPVIYRLKFGFDIANPLLDRVKEKYPSIFGASWASSALFEKYHGVRVPEEEIAYIAIHIGAALERQTHKTRVIIVCSSGIGTSQLISIRLQKAIPSLDIVNVISKQELPTIDDRFFDLIISTLNIEKSSKPVIMVSPFIDDDDVNKIESWIEVKNKSCSKIDNSKTTSQLFKQSLIFPNLRIRNRQDIIKFLADQLIRGGYVKKEYLEEALEREGITSTAIGKGVAIPHGDSNSVINQAIAIATLEEAINWAGSNVDLVVMIAFKDNSETMGAIFRRFYNILDDEELIEKIKDAKTAHDIYSILSNWD